MNTFVPHSAAVAVYSYDIAEAMGLGEEMCQLALLCGLVHDIGKHNVIGDLIDKPGPLSKAEFELIRQHAIIGESLIKYVAEVVRNHHERIDGEGYPDQLPDNEIPIIAKVLAIADSYSAMISNRAYRDAMTPNKAIEILRANSGTQFDPLAVETFVIVLASKGEDYCKGLEISPEFDRILQTFANW